MYSAKQINLLMPHRYPLLLIDRVIEHQLGKECKAIKNISFGEEVFSGHFPGEPIYPGVYSIEMGFQTSLAMMLDLEKLSSMGSEEISLYKKSLAPRALQVKKFTFLKEITPGDQIIIHSQHKMSFDGKVLVEVTLTESFSKDLMGKGQLVVGEVK